MKPVLSDTETGIPVRAGYTAADRIRAGVRIRVKVWNRTSFQDFIAMPFGRYALIHGALAAIAAKVSVRRFLPIWQRNRARATYANCLPEIAVPDSDGSYDP
jgi:hypothetical protein